MAKVKIFLDSDVVISSLLSQTGASDAVINNTNLSSFISNFSHEELKRTIGKLGVDQKELEDMLKKRVKIIKVKNNKEEILDKFESYVHDIEDAHIVAGAKEAKVKFLITFNIRDYKIERIHKDFGIKVIIPGELLQYLRSL